MKSRRYSIVEAIYGKSINRFDWLPESTIQGRSARRGHLREAEEAAAEGSESYKFTAQSNFKDFNDSTIDELFRQIKTKDPQQSIFQAMGSRSKPEVVAKWLEDKGEDTVRERIKAIGSKIPDQGLPKDQMPFLPGPPDAQGSVEDVVDALSPGGKMNIDFKESASKRSHTVFVERWSKLAGIKALKEVAPPEKNTLKPGSDAAEEYLTSGLPDQDGKKDDDDANVQMPAQIAAADAVPTQTNILLPKALGMAVGGVSGGDLGAYFSTDNEILDGHHRWAATMLNDPSESIGGFAAIDLKAMGGRDAALKHLTALGNALGNQTKTS